MGKSLAKKEEQKARESRLQLAVANDDVDELHNLIVQEPELLDRVSKQPFPNTPLHVAAAAGKTDVAMELAILRPSFARKLNPEGYSPMHLALQYEHYHIVRALMIVNPKLIRVRGRCGITPLHYVAGKEGDKELDLLVEFLCTCKSSIEDLTSRFETTVHVAVKNHNLKAFEVLLGWLERVNMTEILNWKDKDGNTVLHIAADERQTKIIKLLSGYVDGNAKNYSERTALQIFQANSSSDHDVDQDVVKTLRPPRHQRHARIFDTRIPPLRELFGVRLSFRERCARMFYIQNESAREVILVVSTLTATATYQAALSPPGGYWQDSSSNPPTNSTVVTANSVGIANGKQHQAGKMILSGSRLYIFFIPNSVTFLISMCIILATVIPLWPDTFMICWSMFILAATYFLSLAVGFENSDDVGATLIEYFFMSAMYAFCVVCLMVWRRQIRAQRKINATRRRLGNFQRSEDQEMVPTDIFF